MQISNVMTRNVITAPPSMSLALAQRLMEDHRIRHLPVVQEGQLVGLVSDRDLRQALPSPMTTLTPAERTYKLGTLAIATCMTRAVVTVPPEADLVQGIRQLLAGPYGCVPVLAGGQLVGIVTAIDVLRGVLMDLGGAPACGPSAGSCLYAVCAPDRTPGGPGEPGAPPDAQGGCAPCAHRGGRRHASGDPERSGHSAGRGVDTPPAEPL
jgi:acetoin utilization protein AcuB